MININKKTIFDFEEQLAIGNMGEQIFKRFYQKLSPVKSIDKKFDFVLCDGSTVELKTDTYNMEATPNFFMELYSDSDKGILGGPWRALSDGVKHFVYFYVANGQFIWFQTDILCKELENIIAKESLQLKSVRNKGWTAMGYLVDREFLKNVINQTDIVLVEKPKTEDIPF